MSDQVLRNLEAKFGPVWKDKDGLLWPVALMTRARLLGLAEWIKGAIAGYKSHLASVAIAYAGAYDDRDWYPGDEHIFDGIDDPDALEDDEQYQDLLRWQAIFAAEIKKRGLKS